MEYDSYILYLQKNNGYWEKEPYSSLEEINEALETIFDDEYWWYLVVGKSKLKGDTIVATVMSNLWSAPIDNKMIIFKFQSIDKPKRRIPRVYLRGIASLRLPLIESMKQIK